MSKECGNLPSTEKERHSFLSFPMLGWGKGFFSVPRASLDAGAQGCVYFTLLGCWNTTPAHKHLQVREESWKAVSRFPACQVPLLCSGQWVDNQCWQVPARLTTSGLVRHFRYIPLSFHSIKYVSEGNSLHSKDVSRPGGKMSK